jgi:hypothetical protein
MVSGLDQFTESSSIGKENGLPSGVSASGAGTVLVVRVGENTLAT